LKLGYVIFGIFLEFVGFVSLESTVPATLGILAVFSGIFFFIYGLYAPPLEKLKAGAPLLCRLGFHKWRNYGGMFEVFNRSYASPEDAVYERRECKRCGIRLRRTFVTNPDGSLSCVGWEPDAKETEED
jgi:hypothetical protein